jgi:hypothetical protein
MMLSLIAAEIGGWPVVVGRLVDQQLVLSRVISVRPFEHAVLSDRKANRESAR